MSSGESVRVWRDALEMISRKSEYRFLDDAAVDRIIDECSTAADTSVGDKEDSSND